MTTATIQKAQKKMKQGRISSFTQEEVDSLIEKVHIFLKEQKEKAKLEEILEGEGIRV